LVFGDLDASACELHTLIPRPTRTTFKSFNLLSNLTSEGLKRISSSRTTFGQEAKTPFAPLQPVSTEQEVESRDLPKPELYSRWTRVYTVSMAQCYCRSGQDIATGKSDTIGEAEPVPLNVWHLRSHTSVHFDYTARAEWLPCQLVQTTVRTKPIRAACLATTVSATFPIQDRSACPSITLGLMNHIDRSLQDQRDVPRA
jgi:hypothetical protein